ncbi:thiamine pyrophosphate-dependent dehydrogenase E1 component subunit alpha [Paraburkholderia sp. SOS3]|uniref:thiamine pyrophosphate-dependent dehydrogenase E1 component subunit alpha n=1 Tax=Paraburkholderia sp. SOS3 TaxID=1926494 RepID=UPI0009FAA384|nr:thiamine pyrophosphate-dependent dehydrogenase E1 component subunit alpha [Paraburkholderia sp. SOS3]
MQQVAGQAVEQRDVQQGEHQHGQHEERQDEQRGAQINERAAGLARAAPAIYCRHDPATLRDALRKMILVRRFEESAEQAYMRGLIHGTMHLSIGQEASAIAATLPLTDADYITSTHRGHGHCIGKGADPKRMFAEFFGKETGYCRGRGGSMHIADVQRGNLGANGIVGGGLPIAVGAALSIRRQRRDSVVMCFFGDGANNEGAFHESLNFASIWKLPVIFVCENNRYGMSMPVERSTAVAHIAQRAAAYDMPGVTVDGNAFADVLAASEAAVARARGGAGPSLLECETYRLRGHSKSDRNRYRTRDEIDAWSARDPIPRFEQELMRYGLLDAAQAAAMRADVEAQIEAGLAFAQASPAPSRAELTRYVYTQAESRTPETAGAAR